MALDTSVLEPSDSALVVTTSSEHAGRAFSWLYGRMRSIFRTSEHLSSPICLNGDVIALAGPTYLNKTHLYSMVSDDYWEINRGVFGIASFGFDLAAFRRSYKCIPNLDDEHRPRNPDEIVYGAGLDRRLYLHRCRIAALAGGEEAYILDYDIWNGATPQQVWRLSGRSSTPIWTKNELHDYWKIGVGEGKIALAGMGHILVLDESTGAMRTKHVTNSVALEVEEKELERRRPCQHASLTDLERHKYQRAVEAQGSDGLVYDLTDAYDFLEERTRIGSLLPFHGEILYAQGRSLYAIGEDKPLARFRDEITGLVAATEETVRDLKGRANLRMGARRKAAVHLRHVA